MFVREESESLSDEFIFPKRVQFATADEISHSNENLLGQMFFLRSSKKFRALKFYLLFILGSVPIFVGCAVPQKEFRAHMIEENPNWKMLENCGYESCNPKVDFLAADEIKVRVEFDKDSRDKTLSVLSGFFPANEGFAFDPTIVRFKINNREIITPRVFPCGFTEEEVNKLDSLFKSVRGDPNRHPDKEKANEIFLGFLRSRPTYQGAVNLSKHPDFECFLFFFEHPAPEGVEEMIMDMGEGLTQNGKPVKVR